MGEDVEKAYNDAMFSMSRLNRTAAQLMHMFSSHGATDVTGFGILGHAENLAKQQINEVNFVIHNLPCIQKMASIARACGNLFGLLQGTSAETSGGLLICLPREQAAKYCAEIKKIEGHQAWIIGIVEKGSERMARIIDKPRIIEVETLADGSVQSIPPGGNSNNRNKSSSQQQVLPRAITQNVPSNSKDDDGTTSIVHSQQQEQQQQAPQQQVQQQQQQQHPTQMQFNLHQQ